MQSYDIAAKVLMDNCREELIRRFLGIDVAESAPVEELPQETVSVKRSDYPVLVTDTTGKTRLAVMEIQTNWRRVVPLHVLDYRTRYIIRHDVEAVSCVILLLPSSTATDRYEDNEVRFQFRLIRVYDLDAREFVETGPPCLLPFTPLMKGGRDTLDQADARLYATPMERGRKADMLTSMAILSGLVAADLPAMLIQRRRDIMIESAAYEIIKNEGFREGVIQGLQEGKLQGIQEGKLQGVQEGKLQGVQEGKLQGVQEGKLQGLQEGKLQGLQEGKLQGLQEGKLQGLLKAAQITLELRFGMDGIRLFERIARIHDTARMETLLEIIRLAKTPQDVASYLEG